MKDRRRLIRIAAFSLAIGMIAGMLAMLQGSGVANAKFDQIKKGMTKNEMEEILGEPGFEFPWAGAGSIAWRTNSGKLEAFSFDRSGGMEWRFSYGAETMPARIRRWLHLD